MAAVRPMYQRGGVTYTVAAAVVGGMLVQPTGTGTTPKKTQIKPATAGSKTVLGVAVTDALPTTTTQNPTVAGETASLNLSPLPPYVAVEFLGVWPLKYAANATFGAKLKSAATGKVTPMAATDADTLCVGQCVTPTGVAATATGATLLTL